MSPVPHSLPRRVLPGHATWDLYDVDASRAIEARALASHAPFELMQRAGAAVARLALAVAPHAGRVWVAAGPGNNGGDGLVAAEHLQRAGLSVQVTMLADALRQPQDARHALAQARQAGVPVSTAWPDAPVDLAIDALLGLGAARAPQGAIAEAIARLNQLRGPLVAVDLPSGLNANTGQRLGAGAVRASHTLALLTLKPGLFTADGRDHAGDIWLDSLGVAANTAPPGIRLAGLRDLHDVLASRRHASHKGSYGDLAVIGGAPGMSGAALLAARAALAAGAGRVFVGLLDEAGLAVDTGRPELMFRRHWWRSRPNVLAQSTVVCGCGGGQAVREALPALLARCPRLVLDADALNALADDAALLAQLDARARRGQATLLTPHPLEAARLLGSDAAAVQADRLLAARSLSQRHGCVVLLKGSGSVTASPDGALVVNPTGNALLASAGTGDVLAGWIGGLWAQAPAGLQPDMCALRAAVAGAWLHGRAADDAAANSPHGMALRAADLVDCMRTAGSRCEA
jgi:hydroxyethylthiazole kinase-like uncharacterized protein yjeF